MAIDAPAVPLQITRGCLVASIQVDLTEEVLRHFQTNLLGRIRETGVRAVILDVSGVRIMDTLDFEMLQRTMAMASLMGATPVIVGLRPGIVSSLIDLGARVGRFRAAFDLDQAFELLDTEVLSSAQQSVRKGTR